MNKSREISHGELFLGFNKIALSSFGGAMPWARRIIVEERRWLSTEEFTSLFGLCQFVPGPNTVNLSVCVGARFQGASGAVVSLLGLMFMPSIVIILAGYFYGQFGELPAIKDMLRGIAPVAAGLILAMGVRMAADLLKQPLLLIFSVLILVAMLMFHWPLVAVMCGLAPLSILVAARRYYKTP